MFKEYGINTGFKIFLILFGIIALPLFLIGILFFLLAFKAYVKMDEEKLEFWWLGKKTIPWTEITNISRNSNGSLLVAMMHSLRIEKSNGKAANLPAGCFVNKKEILDKISEKTGMPVVWFTQITW